MYVSALLVLLLWCIPQQGLCKILDVEFEHSVGLDRLGKDFLFEEEPDQTRYKLLASLWEENRPGATKRQCTVNIPKIMHQIWLSDKPIPKKYGFNQESWIDKHPKWIYKLWTQNELQALSPQVRAFIAAAPTLQEQEELLKIYLLETFGGLVVDLAFQNRHCFDEICDRYDFVAFLEPPLPKAQFARKLHISTALIGSCPSHPTIRAWKALVQIEQKKIQNEQMRNYRLLGQAIDDTIVSKEYRNLIFPPSYGFPLNPRWAKDIAHRQRKAKKEGVSQFLKTLLNWRDDKPLFSEVQPESIAVHVSGGAWVSIKSNKLSKKDCDSTSP